MYPITYVFVAAFTADFITSKHFFSINCLSPTWSVPILENSVIVCSNPHFSRGDDIEFPSL